jgi:hypothetical protein
MDVANITIAQKIVKSLRTSATDGDRLRNSVESVDRKVMRICSFPVLVQQMRSTLAHGSNTDSVSCQSSENRMC